MRLSDHLQGENKQLKRIRLETFTTLPAVVAAEEGRIIYDAVEKVPRWNDGDTYVSPFEHEHPEIERGLTQLVTADSGTTYNISLANGASFYITLNNNCQFVLPTGDTDPGFVQHISLYLRRDSTAGRTVTWSSNIRWPMNIVPALDDAANTIIHFRFTRLGDTSTWLGELVGMGYGV